MKKKIKKQKKENIRTNHVGGVLNTITTKNFTKILSTVHNFLWFAVRKGIVGVRKLSFYRGQFIHFHLQKVALQRRKTKPNHSHHMKSKYDIRKDSWQIRDISYFLFA